MRRQTPLSTLIYNNLYPNPTANDPNNFSAHLAKHLIPEIRIETARFYGSLDSTEARYPGLNYTYPPHIARLARFSNHARLFKVFRQLRLTKAEILDIVRWEGTLWARERFERDEGVKIRDTTGNGIKRWSDPARQPANRVKVCENPAHLTGEDIKPSDPTDADDAQQPMDSALPSPVLAAMPIIRGIPVGDLDDERSDRPAPAQTLAPTTESATVPIVPLVDEPMTMTQSERAAVPLTAPRQLDGPIDFDPDFEDYLKEQIEMGVLSPSVLGGGSEGWRNLASMLNVASSIRATEHGAPSTAAITQPA